MGKVKVKRAELLKRVTRDELEQGIIPVVILFAINCNFYCSLVIYLPNLVFVLCNISEKYFRYFQNATLNNFNIEMPGDNIVDLEGLLKQYIGENKEIIDIKKERLTSPGENYCSIMLKLDITVRNLETGKEEEINAVAKTVNTEVNEFFKQAAHPQFKKEIAFYTEIVPALQQFQREQGVDEVLDLFPKVYAARKNIHGNDDEIDDDSVIIMENLKVQGKMS